MIRGPERAGVLPPRTRIQGIFSRHNRVITSFLIRYLPIKVPLHDWIEGYAAPLPYNRPASARPSSESIREHENDPQPEGAKSSPHP